MSESSPAGRRWRVDQRHRNPPDPHMYDIPKRPELRLLLLELDDEDVDLREFSRKLRRHTGLNRYVMAFASYLIGAKERRINDSAHATAVLGIRGLHRVLEPLMEQESDNSTSLAG